MFYSDIMNRIRSLLSLIVSLAVLASGPVLAGFSAAQPAPVQAPAVAGEPAAQASTPCHGVSAVEKADDKTGRCTMLEDGDCKCAAAGALPAPEVVVALPPAPASACTRGAPALTSALPQQLLRPPSA